MEKEEMKETNCESVLVSEAEAETDIADDTGIADNTGVADETDVPDETPQAAEDKASCPFMRDISVLPQRLEGIEASVIKSASEMRELHKLYHTEFAGRLKRMQDELDNYHEIDKGRVFDGILTDIAKIYSDNEGLVEALDNKQLKFMFMDLLQILESNGVHAQKSADGEKRNTRHCQIAETVGTDDKELHDTVAESMNTGFYVENRTLVKERVHVRVYKEQTELHK